MPANAPGPGARASLRLPDDDRVRALIEAIARAGGRALAVGGWVRDSLLGLDDPSRAAARDMDLEVYGLAPERLESVLGNFGRVRAVGRAFPILLVSGLDVEITLPRRSRGVAADAGDRWSGVDPALSFAEASRGRDLAVNAMAWDPLSGELLDPHGGRSDLERRRLRATDPTRFGEDPIRGLRTAQLAARLEMTVDAELLRLCGGTDLSEVAPERLYEELRRTLLRARRPSIAFALCRESGLLAFFPQLAALEGVPQDPVWHPEGDVWTHTLMVLDEAAASRVGRESEDLALMFGALCHDFGKPLVTRERGGRIVSPRHSEAGLPPTERFLEGLRAPRALVRAVRALVRHHLVPAEFVRAGDGKGPDAGPRAYRRLLRRLRSEGVGVDLLVRVARADHFGRTTEDARARHFPAEALFLERAREIDRERATHAPIVRGNHLLARGMQTGPALGRLLDLCREIQEETGWEDPERILAVAGERLAAWAAGAPERT